MKKFLNMSERLDPYDPKINPAEKILHLSRYEYATKIINKYRQNKKITVLDAACGLGYGSNILQNKTLAYVLGIDLDSTLIKHLIKVNKKNNKIKFLQSDIKSLPFSDCSFDYIVCFETIEHLEKKDGINAIKEFGRVLKKNGIIIISSPNGNLTKLIHRIFPKYNNLFHLYEYQPSELKKILEKNKLEVVEKRGQYPFFPIIYLFVKYLFFLNFLFKPTRLFPLSISRYFIIVAKKI